MPFGGIDLEFKTTYSRAYPNLKFFCKEEKSI
jgi:hypothetical protein